MKKSKELPEGLVLCAPLAIEVLSGGEAQGGLELVVAIVGSWASRELEVTEARLGEMVDCFKAEGRPLLLDVDHRSVWGEESRAAGWARALRIEGERLVAAVELTGYGKALVEGGEYKYLSPTFETMRYERRSGAKVLSWRLHSVALTNVPYLHELPALNHEGGEIDETEGGSDKMNELMKQLGAEDESGALEKVSALKAELEAAKQKARELEAVVNESEVAKAVAEGRIAPGQAELAKKLLNQDRVLYDEFIKSNVVPDLGKETKLPEGTGDGLDEFGEVKEFRQLLDDPGMAAKMRVEAPERYNALWQEHMKQGR